MEAGLGLCGSLSGVHILPLLQHPLKARHLGSFLSGLVPRAGDGSRSGQTLALSPWCPLSGREKEELSDHSEG